MSESTSLIPSLLGTIAVGVLATAIMTVFVESFSKTGAIKVDMLRAIGALFVRDEESFFRVGATVHTLSGIIFAFIYVYLLALLGVSGIWSLMGIGLLIGAAHGFVLSFILIVSVAEHHPLEKYRDVGPGITAVYFLGHVLYGAAIGFLSGLFGVVT